MEIEDLIRSYRDAANEKAAGAEPAARDHALYNAMCAAWRRLHALGPDGQAAFRNLLEDESRHVRAWSAAQLLALGDDTVVPVLEADVTLGGVEGLSSSMVLREWRAGRLGPPFGRAGA
ncbi:MAG TPA: hypothetical protein PKI99_09930 [Terrimesophilobacter sp.]|nr:hypothetical protein [Terrimesophilobacter sp.]